MAVKHIPMRTPRALVATNPLLFGRGPAWLSVGTETRRWTVYDDVKLFATTFAAGFLFVSILLA